VREQRGFVFHKGPSWFVRYSDNVRQPDGSIKWQQVCKKLAVPYGDRYRSKASVKQFVADILTPVNGGQLSPNSTMPVTDFVSNVWLDYIGGLVRPYTLTVYKQLWNRHLRDRMGKTSLRDFRTVHAVNILTDVSRPGELSKSTLGHLKMLLSAIFRDARQLGYLDGPNPITGMKLPRSVRETPETHAYSLDEIQRMVLALENEPIAKTIVLTAALTGLRRSELMGLRVCDFNGRELSVSRSVVEGNVAETKTRSSKAPVPVVEQLKQELEAHITRMGALATPDAPLFQAGNRRPLNLKNLARRVILPGLVGPGTTWRGWHSFRRGLATNLHTLRVGDKEIQTILRHSNIQVTQNIYIKSVDESSHTAMNVLGDAVKKNAEKTEAENAATVALQIAEKALECNDNATAQELVN
jgi:integrase